MSASSKRALDDILGLAVLFIARPLCVLIATGNQPLSQFRNRYALAIRSFATLVDYGHRMPVAGFRDGLTEGSGTLALVDPDVLHAVSRNDAIRAVV